MTDLNSYWPPGPRWGETVALAAVAPGTLAAAVLSVALAFAYWELQPNLGWLGSAFAWAAVATPTLVLLGTLTLLAGVLLTPFTPGRPRHKWCILLVGLVAWGAASYWLSVPGLIELP